MSESENQPADLQVVPAEVVDAGQYVQQTADTLVNALHSLDTDIDGLLGVWKGLSASSYQAGWQETKQGAVNVLEALAKIADLLGVNSRTYVEQDESNSQSYGSLNI
ncbi:WXG100 family type VII secretion target [Nocardia carnea]|uniref:ESAT-6-like protein n=1 Tax=Nocardia carnea TaxID=37328 RepID=A0ABW7TE01_9NOCA|nr:WXG100 family type VII secretion target [Nocardia carnea]